MPFDASAALRHTPKQTRGQKKVDHILRSAEALFAEVGFENATTNAIASRAGVSIGSLYQFFSSKEAILEAMASRYLEQTRVALDAALHIEAAADLSSQITKWLELLVKLQEQRPYFLQCLAHSRPSPALSAPVLALSSSYTLRVEELLKPFSDAEQRKTLALRSRIVVETASALLPIAVQAKGRARVLAISEITLVLVRYLEPTLQEGTA